MPSSDPTDASSIDVDDIGVESPIDAPDPGSDSVSRRLQPDECVSTAVVLALAEVTGTDPTDLSPPLHEVIDPEALDRLFDRSGTHQSSLRIDLELYGCRIAVDEGRRIDVRRVA